MVILLMSQASPSDSNDDWPDDVPNIEDSPAVSLGSEQDEDVNVELPTESLETVDGSVGSQMESLAHDAKTSVQVTRVEKDLPSAAEELLCDYRDRRSCLLRSAGYLDLRGRIWGCVVEGAGWVDLCVLEEEPGVVCTARTVHLVP